MRIQNRQRDYRSDSPINYSYSQVKSNWRVNSEIIISPTLTLRNRIEYTHRKDLTVQGNGYLMYQDLLLDLPKQQLSISARYAIFQTSTYEDRLYAYEQDVLYSYSIPAYFYTGQRFYVMLQKKINRNITAWLRYSNWIYLNQNTLGSGNDEILGNKKPQLSFQLRYILK